MRIHADLDPDPGQTLPSQIVGHEKYSLCRYLICNKNT